MKNREEGCNERGVSHIQICKTEMFNKIINTVSQNKENRETTFINQQPCKPQVRGSSPLRG